MTGPWWLVLVRITTAAIGTRGPELDPGSPDRPLDAATLTREGSWASADAESVFRASLIELGLLALVVLVLVFAVTLLRRYAPAPPMAVMKWFAPWLE